ncbi:hypothetical protein Sjap_010155 [Stephania japonica]|uniref:TF-B3 domain-containing protein n=1 Tax=Stephania japonica TaxID=461633 RepID=A0AAP0P3Z0_9MAGN
MGKKSGRLIRFGDGKTWPVSFVFSGSRVRMVGGWSEYVRDNGLRVGDVCFFELVKAGREIEMKVETARAHKITGNGGHIHALTLLPRDTRPGVDGLHKMTRHIIITNKQNLAKSVQEAAAAPSLLFRVPPSFVEALGGALPEKYTLQGPTGERRVVEVKKSGCQWFFRGGWGPFMEDYSVRYGDILVFTLHGKAVLHFQVYDRNGYLKKSPSSQDGKQVKVEKTPKGARLASE